MKRDLFKISAVLCFPLLYLVIITGVPGKWHGSVKARDGSDFPLTYVFAVNGDKLTGTATTREGELRISNGKINGIDFTYTVSTGARDILHTGKYFATGDSISMDIDVDGEISHTTLIRIDK